MPTAMKKLTGNAGKRPLNKREPKFTRGVPHCPDWLDDEALMMWNRLVPELASTILTRVDEGAMVGYCVAWGMLVESRKDLAADGLKLYTEKGGIVRNPAITALNNSLSQLRSFGSDLGLNPAARTRINVPEGKSDDLGDFISGGRKAKSA